jgi:hypothetical protein
MRNIFLLYMPPNNLEAMTHYRDTIQQKVPLDRIGRYVSRDVADRLGRVFGQRPIAVWGSRDSSANRAKFEKMSEGDDLLIVEGQTIKLLGKVALKTVNADLSRELWRNINPNNNSGWDLIYFIANPVEIGVPFRDFCSLFSYGDNYQLRGLTTVSAEKLEAFYDRYDDLYDVLKRLRGGQPISERPVINASSDEVARTGLSSPAIEEDEVPPGPLVSDHVRMQWKLASLGLKAGEKIWVPTADQGRLRAAYNFSDFEAEFAAGIDLPKNYFENIDVVWKEEFRIDAAFEVENSTSIYSGLLRFADLNVVAPNTTYPMFIVAPAERRNRVREQLLRPAFRRLDLRGKVRFLPYETVDDIERFFASSVGGLTVELIQSKAEEVA